MKKFRICIIKWFVWWQNLTYQTPKCGQNSDLKMNVYMNLSHHYELKMNVYMNLSHHYELKMNVYMHLSHHNVKMRYA